MTPFGGAPHSLHLYGESHRHQYHHQYQYQYQHQGPPRILRNNFVTDDALTKSIVPNSSSSRIEIHHDKSSNSCYWSLGVLVVLVGLNGAVAWHQYHYLQQRNIYDKEIVQWKNNNSSVNEPCTNQTDMIDTKVGWKELYEQKNRKPREPKSCLSF
jgi:hypothetical protein